MKKIIYTLLLAAMFVACSDNHDDITTPENNETYPISFNVSSLVKEVDPLLKSAKLSRADQKLNRFLHLRIKRTEPLENNIEYIRSERFVYIPENVAIEDYPINLELPVGTYELSSLLGKDYLDYIGGEVYDFPKAGIGLLPSSGNTTVSYGYATVINQESDADINPVLDVDNSDRHMSKPSTFTVSSTGNNTVNVELLPMWSNINLTIQDAATAEVPEGTKYIALSLYRKGARFIGFKETGEPRSLPLAKRVKDGSNTKYEDYLTHYTILSIDDFRNSGVFKTNSAGGVSCNSTSHRITVGFPDCGDAACLAGGKSAYLTTTMGISFLSENNQESYDAPLESYVFYDLLVDNGLNYNIKGKLNSLDPESGTQFSISLKSLEDEEKPLEVQ